MLTVFMHAYITGFMGDTIEMNAKFTNGHLKVMTRAYADEMDQIPNDLALVNVSELTETLSQQFPNVQWASRIKFGGLIDAPDVNGETKSQGPAMGMGVDLLSDGSDEINRLNLRNSVVRGRLIVNRGEALLSEDFSQKLKVNPGDTVTLIGSTMNGSMSMYNFTVAGTISFGTEVLDRGSIIVDIEDARIALDMPDAAGEMIGFFNEGFYNDEKAVKIANQFNESNALTTDEFTPVMKSLSQQGSMGQYVELSKIWSVLISSVFIFAMSLVLWNAGLLGGLRRYGEVGIRLAMGEEKGHVYRTMIYESIFIGIAGTVLGTTVGLAFAWYVQVHGINISGMMEGASMMLPTHIRTRITVPDFYLGFIPGVLSTVIGTMLAGIGIFKRQTARLFKELEA
jgi:putative ABC transport system permease protein